MAVDYSEISELRLTGMGLPPYSARGLKQTLTPIAASSVLRRTVNGALRDVSDPLFRKYQSVITGSDMEPPALDKLWPGATLTVDCIAELSVAGSLTTEGPSVTLGRTAVSGSMRVADGFIVYRPKLTMKVVSFSEERDEYGRVVSWSLALEEA